MSAAPGPGAPLGPWLDYISAQHPAKIALGLERVVAITSPDNEASMALLGKLGFCFEKTARASEKEPEVRLFARDLRR